MSEHNIVSFEYGSLEPRIRNRVRVICKEEWDRCDKTEEGARIAIEIAQARLRVEYGSILGLLLISIASKLIVELILTWLYSKADDVQSIYQSHEPGFIDYE